MKIKVSVPATSANIGSGFDALGLAVTLYNTVTFEESDHLDISAADGTRIPRNESNLVYRSAKGLFDKVGKKIPPLKIVQTNPIPMARGLGSSSACIIAGLLGANRMLGDVVFYGKGAGKLPTASAVVADVVDALKNGSKVHDSLFWQPAEPVEGLLTDPAPAAYYVRVAGIAPAVVEAIYGTGKVVEERFDGCAYFVEQADEKALAEAARKVEAVGGSVKLVLKRLPEEA